MIKKLVPAIIHGSLVSLFTTAFFAPLLVLFFAALIDHNEYQFLNNSGNIAFGFFIALVIGTLFLAGLITLTFSFLTYLYRAHSHKKLPLWISLTSFFGMLLFSVPFINEVAYLDTLATAWFLAGMVCVPGGVFIYFHYISQEMSDWQKKGIQWEDLDAEILA